MKKKAPPGQRFSEVFELDRDQIKVDPHRFQGRLSEFSEETVKGIVSKGHYDKSMEPVIVWHDAHLNKYIVLSGHSRWEAAKRLYEKGQKDLKTMPVKEFNGDADDAIDYAVLESNRGSTEEGLISDLAAYRRAVDTGKNKDYLQRIFKPESKLRQLQDLYYLNPKGKFIEILGQTDARKQFPYIERNAQWVGQIRRQLPALNNLHEVELFDYLYSKDALKVSKDKFFDLVNRKVNRLDFNASDPLNLKNAVSPNAFTDPINEQIKEIDHEIEKLNKEQTDKRQLIVRARTEQKENLIPAFEQRISDINKIILRKIEEREKLRSGIGKINRAPLEDLFTSAPPPVKKVEPTPEPVTKKPGKDPRNREQIKKQYEAEKKQIEPLIKATISEQQVIEYGLKINSTRNLYSQFIDNSSENKRRLSPTPENLIRWMNSPGKFDLIGVDTFQRTDATADYKSLIQKQKLFNIMGIKI